MEWSKYAICKNCGGYHHSIGDHVNTFRQVCEKCGEQSWDTMVVAREVFIGKWYKPSTWFDFKLERKQP